MGASADQIRTRHDSQGHQEDPAQIRAEIERTRTEMSQTIDAIQRKLDPDRLREQMRETVREATIGRAEEMMDSAKMTAQGAGYTMLDTIRENPIPTALAALGIGWLMMEGRNTGARRRADYRRMHGGSQYPRGSRGTEEWGAYGEYPSMREQKRPGLAGDLQGRAEGMGYEARERASEMRHRAEEMGYEARERASGMTEEARHRVEQLGEDAAETMDQVRSQARHVMDDTRHMMEDMGDEAYYRAYRARSWLENMMDENPLMVGAIALAAGAAIGLALPETHYEEELMGETRDRMMHRTQQMARETVHRAQHAVQEAAHTMQEELQHEQVGEKIKDAAQETMQSVKHAAEESSRAAKEAVKDEGMKS